MRWTFFLFFISVAWAQTPSPLPSTYEEEDLPADPEFDFQYGKMPVVPPDASKTFFKPIRLQNETLVPVANVQALGHLQFQVRFNPTAMTEEGTWFTDFQKAEAEVWVVDQNGNTIFRDWVPANKIIDLRSLKPPPPMPAEYKIAITNRRYILKSNIMDLPLEEIEKLSALPLEAVIEIKTQETQKTNFAPYEDPRIEQLCRQEDALGKATAGLDGVIQLYYSMRRDGIACDDSFKALAEKSEALRKDMQVEAALNKVERATSTPPAGKTEAR